MGHSLLLKKVIIFNIMSFRLLSFWILKQWHFKTVLSSTYAQTHSQSNEKTRKHNQLCPLWPVAVMRKGCPWPPISLFHRRPNSTQPLTHLSHMANWAPVYSPQKRALKGEEKKIKIKKKGRGWASGGETSGNHQAKRALDPAIPVCDPSPLLTLSPSLAFTQPHHHLSSPSPLPLLPLSRLPIISMSLLQWA